MNELTKIKNVMQKVVPGAPHEILLVLDASTGQNAIAQVENFHKSVPLTGLIITKLDGTARGGAILAIAEKTKIPVVAIGVGEAIDDLRNIAQLGYDEEEDQEELEMSLEEIIEYVRVASLLCHETFTRPQPTAPEVRKPTLH